MSIGLTALLDDVAALAKVAAASIDDVAGQAAKAGAKAAGVVIDDAAVTPRYVVGFAADRELPIVWQIAKGSLRNKLLLLLPSALALSYFAPSAIVPLLMLGGVYLCYEGTEKVYEAIFPDAAHAHEARLPPLVASAQTLEQQKVASAIKTDFILSAEIMAITLAALPGDSFWQQAAVLAVVGVGITLLVYGGVAIIVKADDAGVALATHRSSSFAGALLRGLGRAIVLGMPLLLNALSIVGTAAMIWVGGGIIVHGLETLGATSMANTIHAAAESVSHVWGRIGGVLEWLITAAASGLVGLSVGALMIPIASYVIAPAWTALTKARR